MDTEKRSEFDLGPKHSTLVGGTPEIVSPDKCIVCDGPSEWGAQLHDSMTGHVEKYCWECHNMTIKIRRHQLRTER